MKSSEQDEQGITLRNDRIAAQAFAPVRERPTGEQVELPAVPRAGKDLALPAPPKLAGR